MHKLYMYNVYAYTLLYIGPLLYHWVEDVDQNYDQRYQKSVEVSISDYIYIYIVHHSMRIICIIYLFMHIYTHICIYITIPYTHASYTHIITYFSYKLYVNNGTHVMYTVNNITAHIMHAILYTVLHAYSYRGRRSSTS